MSTSSRSEEPVRALTLEQAISIANMVVTRSNSNMTKAESEHQDALSTAGKSSAEPMDNELFIPLVGPLPRSHIPEEEQNSCAVSSEPPEPPKSSKTVQKRRRRAPAKKPDTEQAKKKKAIVVKRGTSESDDLNFTETKPDAATTMEFPLPKINHGGIRPSRVPKHLYSTPSIPDMDDVTAVESAFRDLLSIREIVDWETRRLGRRLRLLKRKMSLEERREDSWQAKLWEVEDDELLEKIRRLEEENDGYED